MLSQPCLIRRTIRSSFVVLTLICLLLSVKALDRRSDIDLQHPTQGTVMGDFSGTDRDGSVNSDGMLKRLSTISGQLPLYFSSLVPGKGSRQKSHFDPLTTSAWELQEHLENGTMTSEALVRTYLDQINKHNINGMGLRAMVSLRPEEDLLRLARERDAERLSPGPRGPLHGIPVIVKDTYNTPSLGLDTTCGTLALKGAVAREDAAVVKRAIEAGLIILGKTNPTELSNYKGVRNTAGWSAAGGQTLSPYVRGGVLANATFLGHSTPSGSSSGSCVGVAAGFAPIAFGGETDGSVVQPASRAAVFGLKATPALADTSGTQPGNPDFDSLGVMSKSAVDILNLWNLVLGPRSAQIPRTDLSSEWKGLRVGFVDHNVWQPADFVTEPNEEFKEQSISESNAAADKIELAGARVVRNIELITTPNGFDDLVGAKFKDMMASYFGLFDNIKVHNLEDLVKFNKEHADQELPPEHPSQGQLEGYLKPGMGTTEYDSTLKRVRTEALDGVEKALNENEVDVIMAPGDSRLVSVAAAAGCPVANVPLGFARFNGRAHGLTVIARPQDERALLRVMMAWERTFTDAFAPPPEMIGSLN